MIRRILYSLLGLFLLLCAAVAVLATTNWGARFVLARVGGAMSGQLSYTSVQGTLAGRLHINGLHYRTDSRDTRIQNLDLSWSPLALFTGTLDIDRLHLSGVTTTRLETAPPSSGSAMPNLSLPLSLKVHDLSVQNVTVKNPGSSPIHINNISLSGTTDRNGMHFNNIDIDTPWIKATLKGTVKPQGSYPMNLHVHWKSTLPDMKAVTGALHVHGSMKSLHLSQHINDPVDADITAHVTDVMTNPHWSGHVVVHHLDTSALGLNVPVQDLHADLTARGSLQDFASEGRATVSSSALGPPVTLRYELTYRDQVLHVAGLTATAAGVPTRVHVAGTVTRSPQYTVDLKATWDNLVWPLSPKGPYTLSSGHGEADLKGPLDNYTLTVEAPFNGASLPASHWRVQGHGDRHSLQLTQVKVRTLDGVIRAHGRVAWRPVVTWDLMVAGRGLNPGVQWSAYPGNLAFDAAASGRRDARATTVQLQLPSVSGRLRGQPFSAKAALAYADKTLKISSLRVASGRDYVTASGAAGARWDMQWTLKAPDLGTVMPAATGAVDSTGHITGPLHQPQVNATLDAANLKYSSYQVGHLQATASVDMAAGSSSRINVTAGNLQAAGRSVDRVELTGHGTLARQQVQLHAASGKAVLAVSIGGGYRNGQWTGTLSRLALTGSPMGNWHLAKPVPIAAGPNHLDMQSLCWVRGPAHLCAKAQWRRNGPWQAHVDVHRMQLAWLQALTSTQTRVSGAMEASLDAVYRDATLDLQAGADVSGATATVALPDGSRASMTLTTATFAAHTSGGKIHSQMKVVLANGDRLDGRVTVPVPKATAGKERPPLPLSGTITARWTRFDLLPHFMTTVAHPSGVLTAELDLGGTLSQPDIAGTIDLAKASMDVPVYGLKLTKLKVHAASSDGRTFAMYGSVESGGGTAEFHADGRLPFTGGSERINLTMTTRRFLAVDTTQLHVIVTSDLRVKMTATAIDFTGNVYIPEARINQPDLSSSVKVSSDVVIVKGGRSPRKPGGRALSGVVEVRFGDKVQFTGYGLKAKVTGDIAIKEQPKEPILGFGGLNVTGTYKAYGQNLTITQGRIAYVGSPIENPGLDIRAERKTNDVTAGIHATGTVQQPRFTIFSQPPMDQSDALSYLLLGHPINQANTQQGKELASAAMSLGLTGGEFLAKKLGRMFGIQEVEVDTNPDTGNPALILGTYLRPDLFVSYGFDVVQHINILRVQYQVTKQWAIDAQSGLYTGADILYTIETH